MDLDSFLTEKAESGAFDSAGSFQISIEKAWKKLANYALPEPELWVIRLMQAFAGLKASKVCLTQGRKSLSVRALCPDGIHREQALSQLFQETASGDPRLAMKDAIRGAVGRELRIEMIWRENDGLLGLRVQADDIQIFEPEVELEDWTIQLQVEPCKTRSRLQRLFRKADFSGEFRAITSRGLLAPYLLTIDSRPIDLAQDYFSSIRENWELRYHRGDSGPRIRGGLRSQFAEYSERPKEEHADAFFVMSTSWCTKFPKRPTVHWVKDGFVLEHQELGHRPSPLRFDFFFPADGLQTDLSRLKLVDDKTKARRLEDMEFQVCLSLVSHSLCWNPELPQPPAAEVAKELGLYFGEAIARCKLPGKQLQRFQNMTKLAKDHQEKVARENHSRRATYTLAKEAYQAQLRNFQTSQKAIQASRNLDQLRRQDASNFARNLASGGGLWARLDSDEVGGKLEGLTKDAPSAAAGLMPMPTFNPIKAKSLMGEVYIRLPRRAMTPSVLPKTKKNHKSRESTSHKK